MATSANIEAVRRFYTAGPADDDSARAEFAVPDIVWHVPGDNPVSGRYQGYADVFTTMGERMQPLDEWSIDVREVMANGDMVVAVVHLLGVRGPHRVDSVGAHVFRFAADGRMAEVWGFVDQQSDLDELFRSTKPG